MLKLISLKKARLEEMIYLVQKQYETMGFSKDEIAEEKIHKMLDELLEKDYLGKALLKDDELIAFIGLYGPINNLRGEGEGVISPLGCNAFMKSIDKLEANMILNSVWVDAKFHTLTSIVIKSINQGYTEFTSALVSPIQGYQLESVDMSLKIENYEFSNLVLDLDVEIRKTISKEEIKLLYDEVDEINKELLKKAYTNISFEEWYNGKKRIYLGVYKNNEIIGYAALSDITNDNLTARKDFMEISSLYLRDGYFSKDIFKKLLDEIVKIAKTCNKKYLTINFATKCDQMQINLDKYFKIYSTTYRRIIENEEKCL